jgi:flagellar basal-body rod protein FlgB
MDILNLEQRVAPLQKELDLRIVRNQLIASNVANIDTPGYKARDLDFDQMLAKASGGLTLKRTDERHLPMTEGASPVATRESKAVPRPDGNNVQMEEEMLKLAQNNIEYNVLVQFVSKRISGIRRTIEGIK